jgi:hypothetical protein
VENGLIQLEDATTFPEGAVVEVRFLAEQAPPAEDENIPSLYERLKNVAGKAVGLPCDLAERHDYYLHSRGDQ